MKFRLPKFSTKRFPKTPSSRRTQKRSGLRRQIGVGVLLILVISLVLTAVWYGTRIARLTIIEIEVIGGETIDHTVLEELAEQSLVGTYYRLVPKQFAYTYPREVITERIKRLERVRNVEVKRVSGQKLLIVFEEYVPVALWCETLESTECLFLDHTGYAFAPAPKLQGGAFLRYSDVAEPVKIGVQPFDKEFIARTNNLVIATYDQLGLNIRQVIKTGPQEVEYHIAGGGVVKVSLLVSAEDTFENLATILGSKEFEHLAPGNFQYIDLRFGNKVFVNEEIAPTPGGEGATSTATSSTSS